MYFKKEWNDTGVPLARFFSFRTYGTWLHGDKRGSVDRNNNIFGTPYYPPDIEWKELRRQALKGMPVKLNAAMRKVVVEAIKETCKKRGWIILAMNVRTNHVHAVVKIGSYHPGRALNALKANATRELREKGLWQSRVNGCPCERVDARAVDALPANLALITAGKTPAIQCEVQGADKTVFH